MVGKIGGGREAVLGCRSAISNKNKSTMLFSSQFDIYPKVFSFFLHNTYLSGRITFSILIISNRYHLGFYLHFDKRKEDLLYESLQS